MEENNEKTLKEDFILLVQKAKEDSCVQEKIAVFGEYYVSKDTKKKRKIKKGISKALAIATFSLMIIGTNMVSSTIDTTNDVRDEIMRTITTQNPIGGKYETKEVYNEQFRDYVNELNDLELNQLLNATIENIGTNEITSENLSIPQVVKVMEENYLETLEENKTK